MMVLAANMKLQALPFVPLWGLLLLFFVLRGQWLRLLWTVFAMGILPALLVLPFAFGEGGLSGARGTVEDIANTSVSMNAYNMWYWIRPDLDLYTSDMKDTIWGIGYLPFGVLVFCLASLIAFIPMFAAGAR